MAASCSVFLNVKDIDRSVEFYKGLGFKVDNLHRDRETGATRYADLSFQGAELGLGHIAVNDDPEFRAWVGTPLGAGVMVYFSVPNVDRVFEKAKAQRAVIEHEPQDRSYGRVFILNDPDGYVVSFIKEPSKRAAPVKAAATKAKKAVKKAAAKVPRAGTPASRSLAAARSAAIKKGATRSSKRSMKRSDRGIARTD